MGGIKKVPLCPFCGAEMEVNRCYGERGYITLIGKREDETKQITLPMYVCKGCGFVALWLRELSEVK